MKETYSIRAEQISKTYGSGRAGVHALKPT